MDYCYSSHYVFQGSLMRRSTLMAPMLLSLQSTTMIPLLLSIWTHMSLNNVTAPSPVPISPISTAGLYTSPVIDFAVAGCPWYRDWYSITCYKVPATNSLFVPVLWLRLVGIMRLLLMNAIGLSSRIPSLHLASRGQYRLGTCLRCSGIPIHGAFTASQQKLR